MSGRGKGKNQVTSQKINIAKKHEKTKTISR